MAALGFFRNRRVELIEGGIIEVSAVEPPHSIGVELLRDGLRAAFGLGHRVRIQQPIDAGRRTQPEPDAAVVVGQARDFGDDPRDAPLAVEVGDTTLRYDRRTQAHPDPLAGILDYRIVSLVDRRSGVHRNPEPDPTREGVSTTRLWRSCPRPGRFRRWPRRGPSSRSRICYPDRIVASSTEGKPEHSP